MSRDHAAAVATAILAEVSRHLQEHWTEQMRELRDRIAEILRDEIAEIERRVASEVRISD